MHNRKSSTLQLESISQPEKVKILILTETKTAPKDFFFIRNFSNLIKIDLSHNKLSSFPQGFNFTVFKQLKTLFLHYNKFSSLNSLVVVSESNSIIYLTLFGNPLEEAKTRHFFVNQMKNLMLMDDKIVLISERNPGITINEI